MGGELSLPLPTLPSKDYCCISTYHSDSLCLIYLDEAAIESVRKAVLANWPHGIREEKYMCAGEEQAPTGNCLKFEMRGKPFQPFRKVEYERARLMVAAILRNMLDYGWKCIVSSDLSQTSDRGSWFFKRVSPIQSQHPIFSVELSSSDKLQINDCPEHLHKTIRTACGQIWCNGIQSEDHQGRTYEIKLKGNPWSTTSKSESCSARLLIKELIQKLTSVQYDLCANSNLTGMADTLFFEYNKHLRCELQFCAMSLMGTDRMRLLHFPDSLCQNLKQTVLEWWIRGIQDTIIDANGFEMKLKGTPWCTKGQEAIASRHLISKVLETIALSGWYCVTGIDLTRSCHSPGDKATLLFREGAPSTTRFTCISLSGTDKVRFIDAPTDVVAAGRDVIQRWPMGLSEPPIQYRSVSYFAKLKGTPWSEIGKGDGIYGRALLLGLWHSLQELGWMLVLSTDVPSEYINQDGHAWPMDVHSWWFMYNKNLLGNR